MTPHRSTLTAALAALVAFAALISLSAAGSATAASAQSLSTLRLDPRIAEVIERTGHADALVTLRNGNLLRQADRPSRSLSGARLAIGRLSATYDAAKGRVFDRAPGGLEVLRRFDYLPTSLVRFRSVAALDAIASSPAVLSVVLPERHRMMAQDLQLIHADQTVAAGNTGAGTYVAVIDTGTDYTRAAFGSCSAPNVPTTCKVYRAKEYSVPGGQAQDGQPDDGNFHGTNVSGIIESVAPSTKILALDVFTIDPFDGSQTYDDTALVAALNDVVSWKNQGLNIKAVNMSIGYTGTHNTSTCTTDPSGQANPIAPAFAQLRQLNILPVVAAGNDGGYNEDGISYPACTQGAVSVGAVYDSDIGLQWYDDCLDDSTFADEITCFSQSGPTLGLLAPGADITAAGITMSGTSQATPHVTGAVAALAAARPSASASAIETALETTGPLVADNRFGGRLKHRLDVAAALAALPAGDTTAPVVSSVSQVMPSLVTTAGSSVDTSGRVPVKASWTASDAGGSGLASYTVDVAVNGAWTQIASNGATATVNLAPGANTYQFAVRATDGAGNVGSWAYGPTFKLTAYQEDSTAIAFVGTWSRPAWTSAWGGYEKTSGTAGNTATFSFTGRNVAWVAPTANTRGQATISIDGTVVATRDLYSSTTLARAVAYSYYWPSSGTHKIQVKVYGTSGRPTIDVDAFVVMS